MTARITGPEGDLRHQAGRRILVRSLFLIVPAAALVTVGHTLATTGRSEWAALRPIELRTALAALALTMVPWFTDAGRMAIWSRFLGAPLSYGPLLRISAYAELGAAVTPPAVGTTPVKIALLLRQGISGGSALTLTTLSSLEDWLFLLMTVPFCLASAPAGTLRDLVRRPSLSGSSFLWLTAGALILGAIAYLLHKRRTATDARPGGLRRRILETVREFARSLRLIARKGKTRLLLTLALTAVQWGCRYSVVTVLVSGMGLPIHPIQFFALQAVIFALSSVMPTPGGAGGMEALFMVLYRPLFPGPMLGIVTAAWRVSTFYVPVLLAAVVALAPFPADRDSSGSPRGTRPALPLP